MTKTNYIAFILIAISIPSQFLSTFNFANRISTLKLRTANSKLTMTTPITGWNGTLDVGTLSATTVVPNSTETITFSNGLVTSGTNMLALSGTYDPATGDTLRLGAGDSIEVAAGSILQGISITGTSGSPSQIRGQPVFSGAIVLVGATNYLNIGIQNGLSQNITLNGGTVKLVDSLRLCDGVKLAGNGTVDINNYSLILPETQGSAWTGSLTFKNARDIQLSGYTALSGTWTFGDTSGGSTLNGNGNIIDLSGGGTIALAASHSSYWTDLHIKGLGTALGTLSLGAGATIYMSRVTIELGANYTHSQGTLYVQGDYCKLISGSTGGGNFTLSLTSTSNLTVDHAALIYDPLLGQNTSPLSFTNVGTQRTLSNGGTIRSAILSSTLNDLIFDVIASSPTLTQNYDLTSSVHLILTNSLGGAQSMTLDGGGYFLQFPLGITNGIQIANNLTVTMQNINLKDFNGSVVQYGTSSGLNFGDNAVLELNADVTFGAGTTAWAFTGNGTIEANGRTLYMNADNKITITGNKTLVIKNANININSASPISCLTFNSTVQFMNCRVCVEAAGYTFAQGSMSIKGDTFFVGANATTAGALSTFSFTTSGTLTVQTCSSLTLAGDLNFSYAANPTPGLETLVASKRHLKLTDPSSRLVLDGCSLTTTATGLALDYGELIMYDLVKATISTSAGADLELGSALEVQIKSGAVFDVDGPIKYTSTTYP